MSLALLLETLKPYLNEAWVRVSKKKVQDICNHHGNNSPSVPGVGTADEKRNMEGSLLTVLRCFRQVW